MDNRKRYIVVPAPGHYGDRTRVLSSHRTVAAARKAASGPNWAVYEGHERKGAAWLRVYEQGRQRLDVETRGEGEDG